MVAAPCRTARMPRVAMRRARGEARRSGRITSRWVSAPTRPMATAAVANDGVRALGEVEDARPSVDQHQPVAQQGVHRPDPQAEDRELEHLAHRADSSWPGTRCRARTLALTPAAM